MKNLLSIILLACMAIPSCGKHSQLPGNARLYGDYWISCNAVQRGLYHCKVYRKAGMAVVKDQVFLDPGALKGATKADISDDILAYEDEKIVFNGGALLACDIPEDSQPAQSVDSNAGGPGTRVWISWALDDEINRIYRCTVYSAVSGKIVSTGAYRLMNAQWDPDARKMRYSEVSQPRKFLDCFYYSGIGITLNDRTVLMPAGSVDYPDDKGGGVRVVYGISGNKLSETQY